MASNLNVAKTISGESAGVCAALIEHRSMQVTSEYPQAAVVAERAIDRLRRR